MMQRRNYNHNASRERQIFSGRLTLKSGSTPGCFKNFPAPTVRFDFDDCHSAEETNYDFSKMPKEADENGATRTQNSFGTELRSRQPNSVQRSTYIRGNDNKKKIKQPDFPAEAPESSSH
jgi:hypothetical protein